MTLTFGSGSQQRFKRNSAGTSQKYRVCADGQINERYTGKMIGFIEESNNIDYALTLWGPPLDKYIEKYLREQK